MTEAGTPTKTPTVVIEGLRPDGLAVGVDLGGTNIGVGVIDHKGKVLGRSRRKTQSGEGVEPVIDRIALTIQEACAEADVDIKTVGAIGVGAPGPVDPGKGVVIEAVNLRWNNIMLAQELKRRLGPDVFLDNDANVAVFGEAKKGAGRGATDMIGVWVGTGVGAGLMLGGRLFYGKQFTAGEIGHMILIPGAAPGARSIEHNCSRTAIVDRITRLIRANRKSMISDLVGGKMSKIKSRTLAEAYKAGDELTVEVIDDSARRLGLGIGSIVTLLSLERVVIGGGLTEALGEQYVKTVRKHVKREAFPEVLKGVEVVESELGDDAGIIGAGLLALHRLGV